MTKYIDRNWAKWEANIAPVIMAAEEEELFLKNRRKTVKMCEEDPDESVNQAHSSPSPFNQANSPLDDGGSYAETMFSHLPKQHPYNKAGPIAEHQPT